jgi:hypothetical protein
MSVTPIACAGRLARLGRLQARALAAGRDRCFLEPFLPRPAHFLRGNEAKSDWGWVATASEASMQAPKLRRARGGKAAPDLQRACGIA